MRTDVQSHWPSVVEKLFTSTRYAGFWFVVRLWLGLQWFDAGWHKVTGSGWMWWDHGTSIKAFWERVIVVPATGKPTITFDWYREFLLLLLNNGSAEWFGSLIALGETAIGLGLILGAFTGIAAFFGVVMNANFMLAGTTSTNPVLGFIGGTVLFAYRVAGHWGLDRWILSVLGTPWQWLARVPMLSTASKVVWMAAIVWFGASFGGLAMKEVTELFGLGMLAELFNYAGMALGASVAIYAFASKED